MKLLVYKLHLIKFSFLSWGFYLLDGIFTDANPVVRKTWRGLCARTHVASAFVDVVVVVVSSLSMKV